MECKRIFTNRKFISRLILVYKTISTGQTDILKKIFLRETDILVPTKLGILNLHGGNIIRICTRTTYHKTLILHGV